MTRNKSLKRKIFWMVTCLLIVITVGCFVILLNINRLFTNAFIKAFNHYTISDVYELKFEDLDVNLLTGSLKVFRVTINPKEKALKDYSYINSYFHLEARKMILKNVDLIKLLRTNKLDLKKIELIEPGIDFNITDHVPVFFPFKDTASVTTDKSNKISIDSYSLEEFNMLDAYFHVVNTAEERELNIQRINLTLKDMMIDRQSGRDEITYKHFDFSIGELTGKLNTRTIRYISFKDFNVKIDSLHLEETPDTLIYHFADVNSSIKNLDMQSADSIYHITMESFNLRYQKNTIDFNNLSFKPNISDAAMQKKFTYRKEHFAGSIGSIQLVDLNFDSLIYKRKLFIGEIDLDKVTVSIYKDLRKPYPPNSLSEYLGQQIKAIPVPLNIGHIKATKINLVNTEIKSDGGLGKVNINRATLDLENMTNLPTGEMLTIKADAYIENKAHAHLRLNFSYKEPQFSLDGKVDKFDMTELNSLTNSYSPASITKGIADEITFSGNVYPTYSSGTMKFLYHDLVVNFELVDKPKWKSTVLGLAANAYLNSANPSSDNLPERSVKFNVVRDKRNGYLSMLIKSILDGVKETFIMSKENKKAYQVTKDEYKKKAKEERKSE